PAADTPVAHPGCAPPPYPALSRSRVRSLDVRRVPTPGHLDHGGVRKSGGGLSDECWRHEPVELARDHEDWLTQRCEPRRGVGVLAEQPGELRVAWSVDRKSTRLNSSHVKISYAVFCLKRKN